MRLRQSPSMPFAAGMLILVSGQVATADVQITNGSNLSIAATQVELGPDSSENPDVTGGLAGDLIPYVESGPFVDTPIDAILSGVWGGDNLDDDDVGIGRPSDGTYAILERDGSVELDFGVPTWVRSVAIYGGYVNRDDGIYSLYDAQDTLLGSWTVSTPLGAAPWTNSGVDSYWLELETPILTQSLRLHVISTESGEPVPNRESPSFREIQVFGPSRVPMVRRWGLLALIVGLVCAARVGSKQDASGAHRWG